MWSPVAAPALPKPQIKLLAPLHSPRHRQLRSRHRRPDRHRAFAHTPARTGFRRPRPRSPRWQADPDIFIRNKAPKAYQKPLTDSPPYLDYLIGRARLMDLHHRRRANLRAVNFLLPYLQHIPNRLLRSEWASRIASAIAHRGARPARIPSQSRRRTPQRSKTKAGIDGPGSQACRTPPDANAGGSRGLPRAISREKSPKMRCIWASKPKKSSPRSSMQLPREPVPIPRPWRTLPENGPPSPLRYPV